MRKTVIPPLLGLLFLVLGLFAYGIADAYDTVPGIITLRPAASMPQENSGVAGRLLAPQRMAVETNHNRLINPSSVQSAIGKLRSDLVNAAAGATPAQVGVVVTDTLSGKEIASYDPDQLMTPASVTKLFSASAALIKLNPDYRAKTTVYLKGDKVALVGGGDIALSAGNSSKERIIGHAGLGTLARETAKALRKQNRKEVTLWWDDSYFGEQKLLSSWDTDSSTFYQTVPTPLAINTGLHPSSIPYDYYGKPALAAAEAFRDKLIEQGIKVSVVERHPIITVTEGWGSVPAGWKKTAEVRGAELQQLVYVALKRSDNMLAETFCRLVVAQDKKVGSFTRDAAVAMSNAKQMGIDSAAMQLHDCSGLSRSGKLSARAIADLLNKIGSGQYPQLQSLANALPRGGFDGTLEDRLKDSAASGRVWAKTGSLEGVRTLAGYVLTSKGQLLTVVVMTDKASEGAEQGSVEAIDNFLGTLVNG